VIGCMEADEDPSGLLEFGPTFGWQRFIEREGGIFRGTTPVENMATGETGTLSFEVSCP